MEPLDEFFYTQKNSTIEKKQTRCKKNRQKTVKITFPLCLKNEFFFLCTNEIYAKYLIKSPRHGCWIPYTNILASNLKLISLQSDFFSAFSSTRLIYVIPKVTHEHMSGIHTHKICKSYFSASLHRRLCSLDYKST